MLLVAYSSTTNDRNSCEMWTGDNKFVASSNGRPVYFVKNLPMNNVGKISWDFEQVMDNKYWRSSLCDIHLLFSSVMCHGENAVWKLK
ncbi:hypothetical protein L6164_004400 [Bauhinia variegata]|uniref:Uncharacterized protein n=1 Tax=Bauhinia variegata TaxID=167791 RepID=A0ACB9Q4Z1_BAUVA|nr:hypothetical protein L6164_004400 [Bauhinia variegata]